jgi:carbon starvation protein
MASIFHRVPGMGTLLAYWYHFAIMFEALFILTAVDTGTRVARFIVQELCRPASSRRPGPGGRSGAPRWGWPGIIITSFLASLFWGVLLYRNDINTIWPMFGVANQLLAAVALAIGTTVILRTRPAKYALVTFLPLCFVLVTTVAAGVLKMREYWLALGANLGNFLLTGAMLLLTLILTANCLIAWPGLLRKQPSAALFDETQQVAAGD